ncbi:hypothetical protein BDU57DRAFT_556637 [Ampelomyces quisqualis]|uniref:SH3 domain-containing protein n=1 Tax=Ampelomyces quisqualis TaxID=50730 RepID=A0A6A5QM22_AMPQU|nr:hypothetical protein BDU57DRAFT_556637 [Ampelomyces quisqualis]
MAHHHRESHLVRRQRNRDDDNNNNNNVVQTVVSVRIVTAQNTFTGKVNWITQEAPKTLIEPAVRPRPTSTSVGGEVKTTTKPAAGSLKASTAPSPSQDSDDDDDASAAPTQESTLMLATKTPTSNAINGIAGLASASASISAAASADSTQGISGGAKAGLALGILVGIGALLVGVLLLYRRKKKQQVPLKDNEKVDVYNPPPPPPAQVQSAPAPLPIIDLHPAPSIHTERTMSTPPRLSLRPLTQFDPAFDNSKNAGNAMLGVAAAGPPSPSKERDLPERPRSAWERPGAASSAPAENPFNDPQQSGPPSANPFGNNAAVDVSQARIPDSPPTASPLHFTTPSHDLANPVVPISSDVNPVVAATATASIPPPTQGLPALPVSNGDAVTPSPASTEDLPASPGPAPTGALPMAGTFAGARSNSPASGPGLNNVHRIQLDFKPSMQDELGLKAGQLVRMLHEYDDGWALCIRMDRSQQGVVPRTCLSKHPVKPRTGPPRQPPPPGMRSPPIRSPMGPGGIPSPRPLSPASGPNSPHPPANGQMSPVPGCMSPGARQMSPHMQGPPHGPSNSNAPQYGPLRGRSNSNAAYAGPPRSMSPGPYGGGPQMSPPRMGRPRSNSANQATNPRRGPAPGPSPMNPHAGPMPARKPVPGMAL